jgi:hypothetical protein
LWWFVHPELDGNQLGRGRWNRVSGTQRYRRWYQRCQ